MRILHLDAGREMRGGQWQALYLMKQQVAAGHEPRLLARGPLAAKAVQHGLAVSPLSLLSVRQESLGADIVHCHDARSHGFAAVASRRPFVVARRVAFPVRRGWLSRWKYARAAHYLAVSRFAAGELIAAGVEEAKIAIVPDAVPVPDVASDLSGPVVAVAINDPRKGQALLADAARNAGVEVLWSRDLENDLRHARMFVYLSDSEGLGSAALLAMSYGVPVVASRVGGLPEVVDEVLVENDVASVSLGMRKVLDEPGFGQRLGREGRAKILARFTFQHIEHATEQVYRKVLGCLN